MDEKNQLVMTWEMKLPGWYVARNDRSGGTIERSELGHWWWILHNPEGDPICSGRTFKLSDAMEQAGQQMHRMQFRVAK
jgi:hypothetical protein